MRHILKAILFFLPLSWSALIAQFLHLFPLRAKYSQLWWEHHEMTATRQSMMAAGDKVADAFEYMSMARRDYLQALEDVLMIGTLPVFVIYFCIAAYKVFR